MSTRPFICVSLLAFVYCHALSAQSLAPIPNSLDEAHVQLMTLFSAQDLEQIKSMKTEKEMLRYHMGFGTGLRNQWHLWGTSPLTDYFNKLGIHQAESMSTVILETFWCRLHNQPFRLEQRVASDKDYWLSQEIPVGGSPKDGAKIDWFIIVGSGKGTVHLGVSTSDQSYWRYVYGGEHGIEPATEEDAARLNKLLKQ